MRRSIYEEVYIKPIPWCNLLNTSSVHMSKLNRLYIQAGFVDTPFGKKELKFPSVFGFFAMRKGRR